MKTFLTLTLATLLLTACGEATDVENVDNGDITHYGDDENGMETDEDTTVDPEEEEVSSVGPSEIPSDLIPSRPQ